MRPTDRGGGGNRIVTALKQGLRGRLRESKHKFETENCFTILVTVCGPKIPGTKTRVLGTVPRHDYVWKFEGEESLEASRRQISSEEVRFTAFVEKRTYCIR